MKTNNRNSSIYLIGNIYFIIVLFLYFIFFQINSLAELLKYLKYIDYSLIFVVLFFEIIRKKYFASVKLFFIEGIKLYALVLFYTVGIDFGLSLIHQAYPNQLFIFNLVIIFKQIFLVVLFFLFRSMYSKCFEPIRLKTPQVIVLGFLFIILLGAFLLFQPFSVTNEISFVDALFTSTSAVCVTGLIVKDTPKDFTLIGQIILTFLMQIGGLGIMVLYASIFLILPGTLSLKSYSFTSSALEIQNQNFSFINLIKTILKFTFVIEGIGAVIFFARFYHLGYTLQNSIKLSLFHSVSAFCNAGFSLFSNSFESFKGDPVLNLNLIFLITMGGIGFLTAFDIFKFFYKRYIKKIPNVFLAPQTKLVLWMYLILNIGGALLFFISEKNYSLRFMGLNEKFFVPLFQAVTARTAGFNTISIGNLKTSTYTLLCILMFIGASSGSTGGGIKVTTFGVLILTFFAYIQEKSIVTISYRRIREDTIKKSISVFFAYIIFIVVWIFMLSNIEHFEDKKIVFEVFSAFGTVGLSGGITPFLSETSRILIIIAMFIGRIGPLTLVTAMSRSVINKNITYPAAGINIG